MTQGDGSSAGVAGVIAVNPGIVTGNEILVRLLELTPEPQPDLDAERLLIEFETVVAARAPVLAKLVPPIALTDAERVLLVELERRQLLWQDALAEALRIVGEQRCGTSHLRAYAQPG
jgi:hypothetical protein